MMELNEKMMKWINLAIDEELKQSYPKTKGKYIASKVKTATIKGLEGRQDDVVSRAFRMAMEE